MRPAAYLIAGFLRDIEAKYKLSSYAPDQVIGLIVSFYELPLNWSIIIDNGSSTIKAGFGSKILRLYDSEEEEFEDSDEEEEDYDDGEADEIPRVTIPASIDGNIYYGNILSDWRKMDWHNKYFLH